jgi:hypothetical protein
MAGRRSGLVSGTRLTGDQRSEQGRTAGGMDILGKRCGPHPLLLARWRRIKKDFGGPRLGLPPRRLQHPIIQPLARSGRIRPALRSRASRGGGPRVRGPIALSRPRFRQTSPGRGHQAKLNRRRVSPKKGAKSRGSLSAICANALSVAARRVNLSGSSIAMRER